MPVGITPASLCICGKSTVQRYAKRRVTLRPGHHGWDKPPSFHLKLVRRTGWPIYLMNLARRLVPQAAGFSLLFRKISRALRFGTTKLNPTGRHREVPLFSFRFSPEARAKF
jgi:hypothetical protein